MYKQMILASDGTRESLVALREGALIAQTFRADVHLLIVDRDTPSLRVAESQCVHSISVQGGSLLELGLSRLKRLGVKASGEVVRGEPARVIAHRVQQYRADLVVVGHRRQSFVERWWSGPSGAYIVDGISCGVLIARDTITDAEFERHMIRAESVGAGAAG